MRPSSVLALIVGAGCLLFVTSFVDSRVQRAEAADTLARRTQLVAEYGLTDLGLFTEARYTRHVSQADLHSPFQDHPMSLEHFPSGSLLLPPEGLRR